jgi:hypothetical protein
LRYRVVNALGHQGTLDVVDVDQHPAASVRWPDPGSSDATITRPGCPAAVVRCSYPEGSAHRWWIWSADVGEMTLYGDIVADKAVLQRGTTIAAEVSPLGMQEYDVIVTDTAVDHLLVLCVVLAVTFFAE